VFTLTFAALQIDFRRRAVRSRVIDGSADPNQAVGDDPTAFSGRTRTTFRRHPDNVPDGPGHGSGDTRTTFRTDRTPVGERRETFS